MKLEDKVAIVTGGGRGIGKAIALAFAREGADLVVAARSVAEVGQTAAEAQAMGRRAVSLWVDIADDAAVADMVSRTLQEFGKIDILVNNAGILGPVGPLAENDPAAWRHTLEVNLLGTFLCCRAVLPTMMERRRGKIINLSGGGATSPRPCFSAYAATKAAVVRVTETLAEEVRPYNIQVNAIAPGAVYTTMTEEILAAGAAAGEKGLAEASRQQETAASPEQAVALAVFLASDEAEGLTGRLISAVWDDWRSIPRRLGQIMASDVYTLRRVAE
jgi:3-oxoacyl-[acyl-carrier protein] reductase